MQYPQRAGRFDEPAAETVHDLARGLFEAGPWRQIAPLRLFGHSMGAIVAFEFARIAEQRGVGGHFYINDHADAVAAEINAALRTASDAPTDAPDE